MVPHVREDPVFSYTFETERQALLATKAHRGIPEKAVDTLLAATWNLTNFGVQLRTDDDLALMAEVIGWFDLVAIQEIADNLDDLRALMRYLPLTYHVVLSDTAGNDERAGFLYDSAKIERLEMAAEVAVPPSDLPFIRMRNVSGSFAGFDRNPYAAAFRANDLEFIAVSVHLYFGGHAYYDEDRRALEAFALARWADQRRKSSGAYSQNILAMGDFNLPKRDPANNVYRALLAKGLVLPEHSTAMGSSLKNDMAYDQVAFHAGGMKRRYSGLSGVFDFDRVPFFAEAWNAGQDYFNATVKYHISDHRPLWTQFFI
jgi:endonuclease/exonuclease/phosphatase family metal-dependent hydrolase